jgi:hypothetical protein
MSLLKSPFVLFLLVFNLFGVENTYNDTNTTNEVKNDNVLYVTFTAEDGTFHKVIPMQIGDKHIKKKSDNKDNK